MNAFEVFQAYMALKAHFNSDYDYQKYNGKVKVSVETFQKRKDQFSFKRLAKHKDPFNYILANLLNDRSYSPIEYKVRDTDKPYFNWLKVNQALTYYFEQDLNKLNPEFNSNFTLDNQKIPIVMLYYRGEITLETLTILLDLTDAFDYIMSRLKKAGGATLIFQEKLLLSKKYLTFLKYDKEKFRMIVKSKWERKV